MAFCRSVLALVLCALWFASYHGSAISNKDVGSKRTRRYALDWQCNNKKRINKKWLCDTEDDCGDGSDELNCGSKPFPTRLKRSVKKLLKKIEGDDCPVVWEDHKQPHCKTLYEEKCRDEFKEECDNQYTEECKVEILQNCKTEHVEKCKTEYEDKCDVTYEDKCTTEYFDKCETHWDKDCWTVLKEQCRTEAVKKCEVKHKKKCVREPHCTVDYVEQCSIEKKKICNFQQPPPPPKPEHSHHKRSALLGILANTSSPLDKPSSGENINNSLETPSSGVDHSLESSFVETAGSETVSIVVGDDSETSIEKPSSEGGSDSEQREKRSLEIAKKAIVGAGLVNKYYNKFNEECEWIDHPECIKVPVEKCHEEMKCRDEPKEVCKNVPNKICEKVPKKKCRDKARRVCKPIPEEKCEKVENKKCLKIPKETCWKVPEKKCRDEPQKKCWKEPHKKCWKVPHKKCWKEPREECGDVWVKVAKKKCKKEKKWYKK